VGPIEVVLFDLGGVVCDFCPTRRLAALAAASGLPESEVYARIWSSGLDADCDAGRYTPAAAHRRIADALGVTITVETLTSLWTLAFEPRADVLTIVDDARARARTGLLTDNGPILLAAMPTAFPEIARRFEWLFFSCALKATKPSRPISTRLQ
jgi:FMN phosphatase YigB (HAD superfamily)